MAIDEGYAVQDCDIIEESASGKAWLISSPNFDKSEWIPKSAIHENSEVWKLGQMPGELVVRTWLAKKKGWI